MVDKSNFILIQLISGHSRKEFSLRFNITLCPNRVDFSEEVRLSWAKKDWQITSKELFESTNLRI
jgi:hypothetical protein